MKKMNFYGIKLISTTDHGICQDKRKNQPKYICWGCHDSWYTKWLPFIYLDLDYDITLEGFLQFDFLIFFPHQYDIQLIWAKN